MTPIVIPIATSWVVAEDRALMEQSAVAIFEKVRTMQINTKTVSMTIKPTCLHYYQPI